MTPRHSVIDSRGFEETYCLHLQEEDEEEYETKKKLSDLQRLENEDTISS
jgi:glycine betaine/choline ABC-type transport system substrate-binding protein